MTLDKLHKNQVAGFGTVIWPWYRIIKERLQLIKFDDIKEKILINGQNAIDMTIINL